LRVFKAYLWGSFKLHQRAILPTITPQKEVHMLMIKTKQAYGIDRHYPANDLANVFCSLLNKKTFSIQDLKIIKNQIGLDVSFVTTQPEL